jgi:cytochrome c553
MNQVEEGQMKIDIVIVVLTIVLGSSFFYSIKVDAQMGQERPENGSPAWGFRTYRSNGERIYFTSISERGNKITYRSGPAANGLMMMRRRLACVMCHGPDGRGERHNMGMMYSINAKDIRWSVLQPEFDAEKFRLAVVKGQDPDGSELNPDMPRWNISNSDLSDIIGFLKTLD